MASHAAHSEFGGMGYETNVIQLAIWTVQLGIFLVLKQI